ncbi:hypothetical protein [Oceanobacillus sp. CFH 90083]|uniref:hypothetical protein n=1 Tax=Oceanobacillus sp. CFH 90083 TaxID=2592336 RepID=UPI00128C3572|nr:hypothetical protein [Oceanobacillus sp. CFH 90083]
MMERIENLPEEEKEEVLQLPNSYLDKGKQEGIEEGIKKGIEEGIRKRDKEIVLELTAKGMSISQIAEIAKLSKDEIEKLTSE